MRKQKAERLWPGLAFPAPCAYCGSSLDLSSVEQEHVIARQFFPERFHASLPVVPACRSCNGGMQQDEDYARTILPLDIRCANNPAAAEITGLNSPILGASKIQRSALKRPALLTQIMSTARLVATYSQGGVFLGEQVGIAPNNERLARVITKIAMGLRWLRYREPFPRDYGVFVWLNLPDDRIDAPLSPKRGTPELTTLAEGACLVLYFPSTEDIAYDVIVIRFYGGYHTLAAICRQSEFMDMEAANAMGLPLTGEG